jgi:hypothetical protein
MTLIATLPTLPGSSVIKRELHTRKTLNWPASASSTKATQLDQHDQIEVIYPQECAHANAPNERWSTTPPSS